MFYIKRLFALFSFGVIIFLSLSTFTTVKTDAVTTGEGLSAVKAYESMGGKITSKKVFTEVAEKGGELIAKKGAGGVVGHFIPVFGELWTAYDIASTLYPLYQLFLDMFKVPQPITTPVSVGDITIPLYDKNTTASKYLVCSIPVKAGEVVSTTGMTFPKNIYYYGAIQSNNFNMYAPGFDDVLNIYERCDGNMILVFAQFSSHTNYTYGPLGEYDSTCENLTGILHLISSSVKSADVYSSVVVPPVTNDISNNFPNGCNYNFPQSIDVNSSFNPTIYDTFVTTIPTSTPSSYVSITKDVATVDNFGNPVNSQSGSITPSNKPKGTGTGFGDFFDSIFKGIWDLLKGILDFFGGLIKLLTDMLMSLLVPRDGYFTDFFGGTRDLFNSKLSLNTNIDVFSPTYVNSAGDGGLTNVSYPIFNTYTLTIPFDMLNPYLSKIREIMKGLIYPLIVFFNLNNIYKLIRGGSILNAAVDSMNSKG